MRSLGGQCGRVAGPLRGEPGGHLDDGNSSSMRSQYRSMVTRLIWSFVASDLSEAIRKMPRF
jgi:hypothetical protein